MQAKDLKLGDRVRAPGTEYPGAGRVVCVTRRDVEIRWDSGHTTLLLPDESIGWIERIDD